MKKTEERFCRKCGAYLPIGESKCVACGYEHEQRSKITELADDSVIFDFDCFHRNSRKRIKLNGKVITVEMYAASADYVVSPSGIIEFRPIFIIKPVK